MPLDNRTVDLIRPSSPVRLFPPSCFDDSRRETI
jgi:hypothetical protein